MKKGQSLTAEKNCFQNLENFLTKARRGRRVNIHDVPDGGGGGGTEGKEEKVFTAEPDVHEKVLLGED